MAPGLDGVDIDTGVYRPATYIDAGRWQPGALGRDRRRAPAGWPRGVHDQLAPGAHQRGGHRPLAAGRGTRPLLARVDLRRHRHRRVGDGPRGRGRRRRQQRRQHDAPAARGGRTHGRSRREACVLLSVILGASLQTGRTLGFALACMVVALVPLFVLEGLAGDSFYPPLAISFLTAVVVSMLVALTVTPALALLLLAKVAGNDHDVAGPSMAAGPLPPDAGARRRQPGAGPPRQRGPHRPRRRGVHTAPAIGAASAEGDGSAHHLGRASGRLPP